MYTNLFKPAVQKPIVPPTGEDEVYDINFCLPVPPVLENDRIRLVPYIPVLHDEQFIQGTKAYPELFTYMPYSAHGDIDHLRIFIEKWIRLPSSAIMFVIIDRTRPDVSRPEQGGTFAGVIACINTFPGDLSTEIGHVLILPAWQRTFVTTNAVGLLLKQALELPSNGEGLGGQSKGGGWGLRRVQWQANEQNGPSVRCAERLGFRMEGIIRWQRVLGVADKAGVISREGDSLRDFPGRHTAMLSLCWDDWEGGGREMIEKLMAR